MRFHRRGARYSVIRTTGPDSYLLAFELGLAEVTQFEAIDGGSISVDEAELRRQIQLGIADATVEPGSQTEIEKVQYSTRDVSDVRVFRWLAKELLARVPIPGAFVESQ